VFFFFFFNLDLRYGPIFRTSVAGRPVVISTDPEFNHYIIKQEGRLVELWYLDSFAKLLTMEGENKVTALSLVHKYIRSIILNHFGAEPLKEKLLPQIEEFVNKTLLPWSNQPSVEVKHVASGVSFNLAQCLELVIWLWFMLYHSTLYMSLLGALNVVHIGFI
jgi:hypothetical protein